MADLLTSSCQLHDGDTIILGKAITKSEFDGSFVMHEPLRVAVAIESHSHIKTRSSPYRLDITDQLVSEDEEESTRPLYLPRDLATELLAIVAAKSSSPLEDSEEKHAQPHPSSPLTEPPPSSPILLSAPVTFVKNESLSPKCPPAVSEKVTTRSSDSKSDTSRSAADSVSTGSKTIIAAASRDCGVEPGISASGIALQAVAPAAQQSRGTTPDPRYMLKPINPRIPLYMERTEINAQSAAVASRRARIEMAVQDLNEGGIDLGAGKGQFRLSSLQKRASDAAPPSSHSSGSSTVNDSALESTEANDNEAHESNPVSSTAAISPLVEDPDNDCSNGDAATPTEEPHENGTAGSRRQSALLKRKVEELETGEKPALSDFHSTHTAKRVKRTSTLTKVAAQSGIFALGALTAIGGLLLWPEED